MDKIHKNKSGDRKRDTKGRFANQNYSNNQTQTPNQSRHQSGDRKGNGGHSRHANGQARDADGRVESK